MPGFVDSHKPGVREFYWERTLPSMLKQLVRRDINPLILTLFLPEIRDYLARDLSYLKAREITEHQIGEAETTADAVALIERCVWFIASYNSKTGGSAYDWFQMAGPYGRARVAKIDSIAEFSQTGFQRFAKFLGVFDNQYFHKPYSLVNRINYSASLNLSCSLKYLITD